MYYDEKILIGLSDEGEGFEDVYIRPKMANRHGMIAGATGTGKTVTLKVMAESFSAAGVPVFLADIKGDLAATCLEGVSTENTDSRIEKLSLDDKCFAYRAFPVTFWDIYGVHGLPLRTTITEMGPLLLSRILGLNDTQTEVMKVIFKIADDESLLLIDTKDLRAMLAYVSENSKAYSAEYGNMSKQSLSAIIRSVIALEAEGGDQFFGEPAVNISDWLSTDCNGRGNIQILDCQKLIGNPSMYATFMLWLISELFETLPEAGDRDRPKMVFFFDEAHLLFDNAPKVLLDKLEQMVKLIRSKGVGIYFITQNPKDIPDGVLSQLGNKIQHALHAYTPAEQKSAKAAAASYRENPAFDTYEAMTNLGIGEALVSVLDEEGIPTIVKKCQILPPQSMMGALSEEALDKEIKNSLLYTKYAESFDRDSAYEFLKRLKQESEDETALSSEVEEPIPKISRKESEDRKETATEKAAKKAMKSTATTVAGTVGREIGNTLGQSVGGKFGKRLGGNVGASLGRGLLSTLLKLK